MPYKTVIPWALPYITCKIVGGNPKTLLAHRRSRGEGGREQGEQALPPLRGAFAERVADKRNMGMKPRPSRALEWGGVQAPSQSSPLLES
jgi:hypothetical protein